MSYNGSGTFLINTAGQPVVSGTVISSTAFNALTADLATGLSTAITKDGQTTVTANLPMAGYKFTGLGAGSAAADSANLSQVQSTVVKLLASVSGADTITAVGSPTVAAYAAGQMFYFVAAGDNTGAVTLNIDSLGAKAVTRDGSTALAAGDIKSGEVCVVVYDGTRFQMINAANSFGDVTINGTLSVTGQTVLATSTGNVGIGTSSPAAKLEAYRNSVGEVARFTASADGARGLKFISSDNTGSGAVWTRDIDSAYAQHRWAKSGTALMVLNEDGNLGIGTSSPSYKLDVAASAARIRSVSAYSGLVLSSGDSNASTRNWVVSSNFNTYGDFVIQQSNALGGDPVTSGTTRLMIDPSGNLGLGVTPSAWGSNYKALESAGNAAAVVAGANVNGVIVSANAYQNNTNWIYKTTGTATYYAAGAGTGIHAWYTAPSGTAGNAITFTERMKLVEGGELYCAGIYGSTSGSAANVVVQSDGLLQRSTSSRKYKREIVDAEHGLAEVLSLRPVTYKSNSEADADKVFGGLIAEEVHEAGLTEFVAYDDNGEPDALHYSNMVSVLVKAIQEQQAMIKALEAKVAALEAE